MLRTYHEVGVYGGSCSELNVFTVTLISHLHQIIDKTAKGGFHRKTLFLAFFQVLHVFLAKAQSL